MCVELSRFLRDRYETFYRKNVKLQISFQNAVNFVSVKIALKLKNICLSGS